MYPLVLDQGRNGNSITYALSSAIYSQCYSIFRWKTWENYDKLGPLFRDIDSVTRKELPPKKVISLKQEEIVISLENAIQSDDLPS